MATTHRFDQPNAPAPPPMASPTDPYNQIFQLNPDPLLICEPHTGRFLAVNDAAILQYGYLREEFLSMSLDALRCSEGSTPSREGVPVSTDSVIGARRHRAKDGRLLDVEIGARTVSFLGRQVDLIVARDVTASKRTESILSTRYALTRLFGETSDDIVTKALHCLSESFGFEAADLWMPETEEYLQRQISWRSARLGDLTPPPRDSRVSVRQGKGTLAQVFHGSAVAWMPRVTAEPGYQEEAAALEKAGLSTGIAFALRARDVVTGVAVLLGRHPISPDPIILQLASETGYQLGQVIERSRMERELRRAEEAFQAFFDDAPVPYHEIDRNGTVVRVNRAECEALGREASEIIGKPIWDIVAPDEREKSRASVTRKLKERRTSSPFERRYRNRDGNETVFRVHARPMTGPDGEMIGMRTAMLDLTESKRSRQQIELQTNLLDQVHDAVITIDVDFRVTYCNAAAERLFGWPAQAALGKKYKDVAGTMVSATEREGIHQDILRRGCWDGEIICTKRAGEQLLVHVSWSVIRDAKGKISGVVGIHRDLTAPKQMEQRLRASEDRLRLAQDALGVGTWEWDFDPGIPKCSEQLLRLYGFQEPGENLTWEKWVGCIHPDDRSRMTEEVADHRKFRRPYECQFRVVWPDGSVHWLLDRAMVLRDASDQPTGMVGVSVDITDQKLIEGASAELAAIVQCADAAIISRDLDDRVLTWNRGAERIYGYSAEEAIGQTMAVLIPPDRIEEAAEINARVRRGESVTHLETTRITKSGQAINALLTVSPIHDRKGAITSSAVVVWDITQIKRLESQLAQAQKLESIGQLAAGIAHEINTPIQYVGDNGRFLEDAFRDLINYAQGRGDLKGIPTESPGATLPSQADLNDGVFEYLRDEVPKAITQLLEGVDHVARIVRAMKEFSHPGPVEKMPVDINRAIESTILVSKNEWKYVAEVTTEFDAGLPPVPCVAGEFNQVILNLIVNAAHAIADTVKDSGAKGTIHITTRRIDTAAEIRIADTGGGIPDGIQAKVFDPFFTTKPLGKGTGQGLALAHAVIVQKHNGLLTFESEKGRGTTFIIQLPVSEPAPAAGFS